MSELKKSKIYTVQKEKSVVILLFFYSDIFCVISDFLYFLTLITCILHCTAFKGTVQRDFRPPVFFHNSSLPGLLSNGLKYFRF